MTIYNQTFDVSKLDSNDRKIYELAKEIATYVDKINERHCNPDFPGGNFYPHDATEEELRVAIDRDPAIGAINTVVKRDASGKLFAVPYVEEYRSELDEIIRRLERISEITSSRKARDYLTAKTRFLRTGTLADRQIADKLWVACDDVKLDLVVTEEEQYEDQLLGKKGSFESVVISVNRELKDVAGLYADNIPMFLDEFPLDDPGRKHGVPVVRVGRFVAGCKKFREGRYRGFYLPNDKNIHGRLVINYFEIKRQGEEILRPLVKRVFGETTYARYGGKVSDGFLKMVLGHETGHGYAGNYDEEPSKESTSLEEIKASVLGAYNASLLFQHGLLERESFYAMVIADLVNAPMDFVLGSRQVARRTYKTHACIQWNLAIEAGIIDDTDNRFSVVFDGLGDKLKTVVQKVLRVKSSGNQREIERFVREYEDPTVVQYLVDKYTADLPI